MNNYAAIGRIVKPVELKDVGEGRLVVNNTIAIQRTFKSANGQDADFIPFQAWGNVGERIAKYCQKGDLVGLTGRVQSRSYLNREEEPVYVVEMIVESVRFLQNKNRSETTIELKKDGTVS